MNRRMYQRLTILSVIILAAVCGLVWLGYHSVQIWAQGMEGTRIGEFAEVAEQIRQDVKRKLDEFMTQEQNRPYTDYQYYYVPDNTVTGQQQMAVLRSPLAGQLEHGLAYGHFQIQPDSNVTTPIVNIEEQQTETLLERNEELYTKVLANTMNIENNLFPALSGVTRRIPSDLCSMMAAPTFQSGSRIAGAIIRAPARCWISAPWKAHTAQT